MAAVETAEQTAAAGMPGCGLVGTISAHTAGSETGCTEGSKALLEQVVQVLSAVEQQG